MKPRTHSKRLDTAHEGGHALLVFVIILLTSIGSYSFYNKGTKKADIQVVARSLQQISAGDVFAHKIIGRVMAALKDAPHSACYDGTELSKILKGYAEGALRDFTPILDPNLASTLLGKSISEDSHQILLIFSDDHKLDGSADQDDALDALKALLEDTEYFRRTDDDILNIKLTEGMNTVEYLNNEKTENCLSSIRDRKHIISYYIRITPISVKPEAYSKRILLEVGGVARMPHGASQVTSFKKSLTFDMSYSSLENMGFVFNNAQQRSASLITLSAGTELEFKTPVFLHDAAGNISSLGRIMSKSSNAGWDGSNLLFQKKFYTNRTSLDISEAESLGAFVASFTQGIALKTFYELPFEDYLPPTFALKYEKDPWQGNDHPPLPTSGEEIFENCQSDNRVDEAQEVIDTGSSFVITVNNFSSCEREYPFVISTSGDVTIDFNSTLDSGEDEVFFCGIIQANNLTIKAPGADIAHVVFGTFVVGSLTIDGADDARVIFQNVKDPFIHSHTNTFISNLYNNHFYRLFSYEFHGDTINNKPGLLTHPVQEVYRCPKPPHKWAYQSQGAQQFDMLLSQIKEKRTTHKNSLIIFR